MIVGAVVFEGGLVVWGRRHEGRYWTLGGVGGVLEEAGVVGVGFSTRLGEGERGKIGERERGRGGCRKVVVGPCWEGGMIAAILFCVCQVDGDLMVRKYGMAYPAR